MKKFVAFFLLIVVSVSLAACSAGQDVKEKVYLTDEETQLLHSNPENYKGKYVKLTGKVFNNVERDDKGIYFQMWTDPENNEKNTVVAYNGTDVSVASEDYLIIEGKIEGAFKGKNAFGAEVIAPRIIADKIEISSYKDVVMPTIKEVMLVEKTQEQKGYSVTVDKIEFAEKETRIYLAVKNNGAAKFNLYSFNALAIQNSKQVGEQSNYNADYPQIQTGLLPGNETEGVISFPALEIADFKLIFDANSDNWQEELNDFSFEVVVE